MSLFSPGFILFFAVCVLLCDLPRLAALRKWILLAASLGFYATFGLAYLPWLVLSSVFVWFCALKLERTRAKLCFVLGVLFPLILLIAFKYTPFLYGILSDLAERLGADTPKWTIEWLRPLGISFYTFRLISYIADVNKGTEAAEKDFASFLIYVSFFPSVISGPIERASNFLPQMREPKAINVPRFNKGLQQILWGVFKKLVIADNLAALVNETFAGSSEKSGFVFVLAVLCYTVQIYCDFSGYSDMAIGMARILGFDLKENFRVPYCSTTIKEFWGRWHISLSTWFRDYVYFPLGGGRCGKFRRAVNILITFLLSGLWHGANWTFVFWGGLHGAGLVLEKALFGKDGPRTAVTKVLWTLFTALLVIFGWLFFRAESFSQAYFMLTGAFRGISQGSYIVQGFRDLIGEERGLFFMTKLILTFAVLFGFEHVFRNGDPWSGPGLNKRYAMVFNVFFYTLTIVMIAVFHAIEQQELIYGAF